MNRMTGISLKLGRRSWPKLSHKLRPMLSVKDLMSKLAYLVVFMGVMSFTVSTVSHLSTPVGFITSQSMTPLLQAGDIIFFQPAKVGDIRVGEIKKVEDHPNAEKLVVMDVDIGEKTIQLVAGIKQHYSNDELVGKKVVVFVNLEPAVLRGVKSEGMILAAVEKDNIALISPEKDIGNGAKIE